MERSIAIGSVLREAAIVTLRHWGIWLLGTLGLAAISLLVLRVLGYCFSIATAWPASFQAAFGSRAGQVAGLTIPAVLSLTAMAPSIVALVFFYANRRLLSVETPELRPLSGRAMRLMARLFAVWLVVIVVKMGINLAYYLSYPAFLRGADADTEVLGGLLGYAVLLLATAAAGAFINARTFVYLPSAAYDRQPQGFGAAWAATVGAWRRAFMLFAAIELAFEALDMIVIAGTKRLGDDGLVNALAAWSLFQPRYVASLLPGIVAFVFALIPIVFIISAAMIILHARRSDPIGSAVARVFE